ncbi:MAG: caspase family protein [Petrotogales bacterium]
MKKIWIFLIVSMFVISMLPGITGIIVEEDNTILKLKERKFVENREVIPIYTAHGLERVPGAKGKPGVYVTITNPVDGETVNNTVTITIDSNDNPSIKIDGSVVGSGLTYDWDTTQYADGSHTIEASAKGHTDTVTVTVDNGGGGNTPPDVSITNPTDDATVSDTVTITVDATDAEDGQLIADIYIDGAFIISANSYDWDTTSYANGSHTIYAEATDSGGLTDSDSITVTVDNNGGYGEVKKYALVIGIADYRGKMYDLRYCDDDAREWKSYLENNGYTVTTLIDRKAKADDIIAEIDSLLALEDGNDYVVVTYSGHGSKYSGYGSCIISHDLYYITHGLFESKFAYADSPHIYFTFDACEIGDFQGLISSNRVGAFASNNEYSYETSEFKNGVFTYYQMEGWNTYDNFEQDGNYAADQMIAWASDSGYTVDPFVEDNYDGYMYP